MISARLALVLRKTVAIGASVTLVASCPCSDLDAETLSRYSEFQAMTPADLATLQVKLTYAARIGSSSHSSLLFTAAGNQPDIALFAPYYRSGVSYRNDRAAPLTFSASISQLESLIDEVGSVPSVTDGDVDSGGYVSFALLNTAGGTTRVFEAAGAGALVMNGRSGQDLSAATAVSAPSFDGQNGGGPEALLSRTLHEVGNRRLDAAVFEIDKAIRDYPNFRLAHLIKGDLLLAKARMSEAAWQSIQNATHNTAYNLLVRDLAERRLRRSAAVRRR